MTFDDPITEDVTDVAGSIGEMPPYQDAAMAFERFVPRSKGRETLLDIGGLPMPVAPNDASGDCLDKGLFSSSPATCVVKLTIDAEACHEVTHDESLSHAGRAVLRDQPEPVSALRQNENADWFA
jgi:hypothetical protein